MVEMRSLQVSQGPQIGHCCRREGKQLQDQRVTLLSPTATGLEMSQRVQPDGQNLRVLKSMMMSFDFLSLPSLSHTHTQMRTAKVLRVEWFARGGSDQSLGCRLQHWVLLSGVELIKRCRSGPEPGPETQEGEVLRLQPPSGSDQNTALGEEDSGPGSALTTP